MATYAPNQLHSVPLAELQPDPMQPRKYLDPLALEELTASVGQVGIIEPIVCRQDPQTGLVYVVAGERRCAAARKAGLTYVPAIFIEGDKHSEIALVENLLRQDLNPIEEAEALKRLMDDHPYMQEDLARIIGKSPTTISEALSLNKLPNEIRDECRKDPTVPKNVLVTIARNKQQRSMATQFQLYRKQQSQTGVKKTSGAKRTKAEALVNNFGATQIKIAAMDLQEFSTEDRDMIMETLTSLKNTLEGVIAGASKPSKNLA
ncbi:MAG: ParB/RepB/Spo0J family partition protein [Deltaproteobacteria bacterium]|nr:ParB/RepB/Spo0J family partition protein [Deltaproteobacteria bacterium]